MTISACVSPEELTNKDIEEFKITSLMWKLTFTRKFHLVRNDRCTIDKILGSGQAKNWQN
jgi:hypothetical protein